MLQLMTFTKPNKSIWMQFATTLCLCFTCKSIITYHPLSSLPPYFPHSQGCNWIWFVAAPGRLCCLREWERSTQAAPEQKPAQVWQRWLPWVLWLTESMYMLQCLGAGYVYMTKNRLKKKSFKSGLQLCLPFLYIIPTWDAGIWLGPLSYNMSVMTSDHRLGITKE